jgi:hypothetical protein
MLLFELEAPAFTQVSAKVDMFSKNLDDPMPKNAQGDVAAEPVEEEETDDNSVAKLSDTRKTRLTLEQINKLRMLADTKLAEYHTKIGNIKKQYSPPKEDSAGI